MTWALLGLVAMFGGASITAAVWYHGANNAKDNARDLAQAEQRQRVQAQEDLRLADMTIKAKTAEIEILKERLATAEQQRNEAYGAARDHLVERIKSANVADASKIVADLLSGAVPDSVLPPKARSDNPRDYLLDPDA